MAINSDQESEEAIAEVDSKLAEIHEYAGRDFSKRWKIRFPRGYIRPAQEARRRLGFIACRNLKANISYTMMLSDVLHWILVRTDIGGTAKEMLIKLQIFLLGTIIESCTKVYLHGRCGRNFKQRNQYLFDNGEITASLLKDLNWLWDLRNNMHLFQLTDSEWASTDHTISTHNGAVRTFREILEVLKRQDQTP